MNKKAGILFPLETVEIALLIGFVLVGVLIMTISSQRNIDHTEEQASIQRDLYLANEMLYVLSATPVQTSQETLLFSQALDKYYVLDQQEDLSEEDERYLDELEDLLLETTSNVFGSSRPYVTAELYHKDFTLEDMVLYSNKYGTIGYLPANLMPQAFIATVFDSKEYQTSMILPSSIDRGEQYYINISMYFYS